MSIFDLKKTYDREGLLQGLCVTKTCVTKTCVRMNDNLTDWFVSRRGKAKMCLVTIVV